jgi:hypothetical protein
MDYNILKNNLENNYNKSLFFSNFNIIINKHINEALKIYPDLRIVKKNGKGIVVTANYCKDRCNIEVENEIVIKIFGFY